VVTSVDVRSVQMLSRESQDLLVELSVERVLTALLLSLRRAVTKALTVLMVTTTTLLDHTV
jgi:hypothetical protein